MIPKLARPKLTNQASIDFIEEPILIKEIGGNLIAYNKAYCDFRKTSAIDLPDQSAYDTLAKIHSELFTFLENYLLTDSLDSFECEANQKTVQLKVSLDHVEFSDKRINAIKLIITRQVEPFIIRESKIHLTARETSVLQLLMDGNSQKQIALLLFLSHHTISGYLKIIYGKLGVRSCSQALLVATNHLNMRASSPFKKIYP